MTHRFYFMDFLEKMEAFEKRNNISIVIKLCSDVSGSIEDFWDNEELERFDSLEELITILDTVKYQQFFGLCVKPIVRE